VEYEEYDNAWDAVRLYRRGEGFYLQADDYDKTFKDRAEADEWLKSNRFELVGRGRD
jgi:hypothetical protein